MEVILGSLLSAFSWIFVFSMSMKVTPKSTLVRFFIFPETMVSHGLEKIRPRIGANGTIDPRRYR